MAQQLKDFIDELEKGQVKFNRLVIICTAVFGSPRTRGSHHIFKTPWQGDPRINLQMSKGGQAKGYQVRQVIRALEKLLLNQDKADELGVD